jgi:hypothetical protein
MLRAVIRVYALGSLAAATVRLQTLSPSARLRAQPAKPFVRA